MSIVDLLGLRDLLGLVGGYLLGAIPFGLLLTRAAGLGDVRNIGSGNIGATNVLRTGRKGLAAATLLLDALKAVAAVLIARWLWPEAPHAYLFAAMGAFLGHLYPVWLGFRGGKGIATALGVLAVLAWPVALIAAGVWLIFVALTRISSAGGIAAAVSAPLAAYLLGDPPLAGFFAILAALVLWKHRANIRRLLHGTEPRIGGKA